jgi:hypothetical protein
MTMKNRIRSSKIHSWVNPEILQCFEELRVRLGFTRDGALERAIVEFIKKHKGAKDATANIQ